MLNNPPAAKRLFSLYIPLVIAAIYLVLAVASVQFDDVTYDEATHLRYGVQIVKGNTDRSVNDAGFRSTMPVSALNAVPRGIEQWLHPGTKKNDWGESDVKNGRYITILLTLVFLLYCFRFASLLSSSRTACIIMAFIACDPNVLAHSRLVTTDLFAAMGFVATIYHLWQWLGKNNYLHFYYWCVAIAIAQCCKPNNIVLYPVCMVPVIFYFFKNRQVLQAKSMLAEIGVFTVAQIIIINGAFLFAGPWGYSLSQLHFRSHFFQSLQQSPVSAIPIPFTKAYIDTFDLVQYERETFDGTALNYLLGVLQYKKGFWNYYLVCYALKTPVVSIFLTIAGIIYSIITRNINKASFLFCYWPCAFVFIFLSNSSVQSGYRYLLPVECLLLIFASPFAEYAVNRIPKIITLIFSFIPIIVAIKTFPNYLSYTNIFLYDKKMAYRFFADSNINWGQRKSALQKFMIDHPAYIYEPDRPLAGMIIVDLNNLAGIKTPEKFKWLRENYSPVATIEDCYLVYDVKELPLHH